MLNPDFEAKGNYNKAAHDVAYLKRLDEYALNRVLEYAGTWGGPVWPDTLLRRVC